MTDERFESQRKAYDTIPRFQSTCPCKHVGTRNGIRCMSTVSIASRHPSLEQVQKRRKTREERSNMHTKERSKQRSTFWKQEKRGMESFDRLFARPILRSKGFDARLKKKEEEKKRATTTRRRFDSMRSFLPRAFESMSSFASRSCFSFERKNGTLRNLLRLCHLLSRKLTKKRTCAKGIHVRFPCRFDGNTFVKTSIACVCLRNTSHELACFAW